VSLNVQKKRTHVNLLDALSANQSIFLLDVAVDHLELGLLDSLPVAGRGKIRGAVGAALVLTAANNGIRDADEPRQEAHGQPKGDEEKNEFQHSQQKNIVQPGKILFR
jgi:hypothetical protein